MTAYLCLCCFASCSKTHKENTWFSEEKLSKCSIDDFPAVDKNFVNYNDDDIYVSFTANELEAYINEIYDYLKSQNFEYLGTRGEQVDTLSGAFTTYYFVPANEVAEFYVDSAYRFVFSDGTLNEYKRPVFCIIAIYDYEIQHLEYWAKDFSYNTIIRLRYESESPLSGSYVLNEEKCLDHIDENADGVCDICGH